MGPPDEERCTRGLGHLDAALHGRRCASAKRLLCKAHAPLIKRAKRGVEKTPWVAGQGMACCTTAWATMMPVYKNAGFNVRYARACVQSMCVWSIGTSRI